jgi:hypothetical protein
MNIDTAARQEALSEIAAIARRHHLTVQDIATVLDGDGEPARAEARQRGVVSRLFNYIGGILVFAGLGVFIGMYWSDFSPAFRVLVTLGSGFAAFISAIACSKQARLAQAVGPLLLAAAVFEPAGLFVMLDAYGDGGAWQHAVLFVAGIMTFQFGVCYIQLRHSVLAFFALLFGGAFAAAGMDLAGLDHAVIAIALGISYLCLATALAATLHGRHAGFWHLAGALLLLTGFYDVIEDSVFEPAFVGLAALLVYLSIVVRSRALLIVSTLDMVCYIGDYAFDVFAENGLFPLALVVAGCIFMGLGAAAMRLDRRYIRGQG